MYETLHRKLKIAEHEHHLNPGKKKGTAGSPEGTAVPVRVQWSII